MTLTNSNFTQAAAEAARADGLGADVELCDDAFQNAAQVPARRGKWTIEEEEYAMRLIHEFKEGLLPLTEGTTLRTFLSKVLNCDPMRISKKFVGANSIGKQIFRKKRNINAAANEAYVKQMNEELASLEKKFLDRVATKGRSRSSRSSATSSSSSRIMGTGRHAATHQYSDYVYDDGGEEDETPGETFRSTRGTAAASYKAQQPSGQARQPAHAVASNRGHAGESVEGEAFNSIQAPRNGHAQYATLAQLQPVTSLEMLCMDSNSLIAYRNAMSMSSATKGAHMSQNANSPAVSGIDAYPWHTQDAHSQKGDVGRSAAVAYSAPSSSSAMKSGVSGGINLSSWPSVQNLMEAASIVSARSTNASPTKHQDGRSLDQGNGHTLGGGGGTSSSPGGTSDVSPPAYRDLVGLGGVKRSAAVAQLEASSSGNNLVALAEASAEVKSNLAKSDCNDTSESKNKIDSSRESDSGDTERGKTNGIESNTTDREASIRNGGYNSSRKRDRTDSILEFQNKIGGPLGQASL